MGPQAFHVEAIQWNNTEYLGGVAEDGFNQWRDGSSQAGSVWFHFGRYPRGAMLRLVCAPMRSISSLPLPSLAQSRAAQDSLGDRSEERGPSSTRAAPLPSHGPRVRNSTSKSGVREIWIVMAARPLADSGSLAH